MFKVKDILNLIRSNNFISLNKSLIKNIGAIPAIMYSELCAKHNYFETNNQLKDGYFYCTIDSFKSEVGLSREEQDTAIKKLTKLGLIEKKVAKLKGDETPKRYIKIVDRFELVLSYFNDNPDQISDCGNHTNRDEAIPQSEMRESRNLNCGNHATNNNNIYNNNNIKINNNNQSVSHSPDFQNNKETDRQTDIIEPNQKINNTEISYDDLLKQYKKQVGYEDLLLSLHSDKELIDEIMLNIMDIHYSDKLKIEDQLKSRPIIESVLSKLNHWHIHFVIERLKSVKNSISKKKNYIQTMIYNSVFEMNVHYENKVQAMDN